MEVSINGIPLVVKLADDDASRVKGLMNSDSQDLPEDTGMLFRWPSPDSRSFWMKDTTLPLDIAYISDKGEILNIEKMDPLSLKSVVSNGPASCAIEVNRGWFDKNGIKQGDVVKGVFNDMPVQISESSGGSKLSIDLANPNFYYADVVDIMVEETLSLLPSTVTSGMEKDFELEYNWNYPINPDVWLEYWEDTGAFFDLELKIREVDFPENHPGWNIDANAGYGGSGATVYVDVQLSTKFVSSANDLASLEPELANVFAHELHHLTQEGEPFERPNCPILPPSQGDTHFHYFTKGCEVPAFLIGFRAESSRTGRPIEELIRSYLDNQVDAGSITQDELEKIAGKWEGHSIWTR